MANSLGEGIAMKQIFLCFVLVYIFFTVPSIEADAGCLVTSLDGPATFTDHSNTVRQLTKCERLREGSNVDLPKGSTVQLVFEGKSYFENWYGPVILYIGHGSASDKSGASNKCTMTNIGEVNKIFANIELFKKTKRGSGPSRVVSVYRDKILDRTEAQILSNAHKYYQSLRNQYGENNTIPDLYLLSTLISLSQNETAALHILQLLPKDGKNQFLQELYHSLAVRK